MKRSNLIPASLLMFTIICGFIAGCGGGGGGDGIPADISGTWVGTVSQGGQSEPVSAVINQNGETISGTLTTPSSGTLQFTGTYVNGVATATIGPMTMTATFRGNKATGSGTDPLGPFTFEATKQ